MPCQEKNDSIFFHNIQFFTTDNVYPYSMEYHIISIVSLNVLFLFRVQIIIIIDLPTTHNHFITYLPTIFALTIKYKMIINRVHVFA